MIQEFISEVRKHKQVCIFSHVRPDGDAIGSQIGLALWLQKQGLEVRAFNDDALPENLKFLEEIFPIEKPDKDYIESCDAIILVDGNDPKRFGGYADLIIESGKPLYMVDHHPEPLDIYEVGFSDPTASSTAEMVYRIYLQSALLHYIDKGVAQALYTGMMTDTGSFRFDSVTPQVHEAIADLLRRGNFSPDVIHQKVYDNKELHHLKLISEALAKLEVYHGGKLATLAIPESSLVKTGCTYDDLDGIIAFALSLASVETAVLLYERDEKVKLSLRSKTDTVDVNVVARKFGGGGHKKAAGAWHNGNLEEAVKDIVETITF